jgi:hypothetical protein
MGAGHRQGACEPGHRRPNFLAGIARHVSSWDIDDPLAAALFLTTIKCKAPFATRCHGLPVNE